MTRTFVAAKLGSSEYLGTSKTVKEQLAKIPEVIKVDIVFGSYDIMMEIETKDLDELSRLVADRIRSIPNIISTETFICCQS